MKRFIEWLRQQYAASAGVTGIEVGLGMLR
jgi:hypothetical protein